MAAIPRRRIGRAIAARLVEVTNATGYYGQIGAKYALLPGQTAPPTPPAKSDTDTRVAPYFVVEPGIGSPTREVDLGMSLVDAAPTFTIRAAAGDPDDLLALVERIDALLRRWSPGVIDVDGVPVICGPLEVPPGYDPRFLTDQTVTPWRHFTPLQYRLTAHT